MTQLYVHSFSHSSLPTVYMYLFLVVLGLSLVVVSGGDSLITLCGLLIEVASLVAEHGLSSCGARA